jgi:hypothetical protein
MILTKEEHQAITTIGNVPVNVDGIDCVLVRADIFERLRDILAAGNSDDPRAAYPAVLRAWDQDDNPADYEDYRNLA